MYGLYENVLMYVALVGLALASLTMAFAALFPLLARAWDALGSRSARAIFLLAAAGMTLFGGAKHVIGKITFPRTDADTWYMLDAGSYVTNTYVHVKFTRNPVLPTTANIFIDGLELCYTNESDWETHSFNAYSNVISSSGTEFDMNVSAATNYNWICYTDWTPPPVVHTNGVAYVAWMIGVDKATNDIAMTRTGVYTNAFKIAPNPAITNLPSISLNLTTSTGDNNED